MLNFHFQNMAIVAADYIGYIVPDNHLLRHYTRCSAAGMDPLYCPTDLASDWYNDPYFHTHFEEVEVREAHNLHIVLFLHFQLQTPIVASFAHKGQPTSFHHFVEQN
jgi:hypothetical protein